MDKLDLLIPENLPTCVKANQENRKNIIDSLNLSLKAIDSNCYLKASQDINLALQVLGNIEVLPSELNPQSIKINQDIVEYDRYFNVNRIIDDKAPEVSLIKSFLLSYQRFLEMCNESSSFDPEHVEKQRQGAKSFLKLIFRIIEST